LRVLKKTGKIIGSEDNLKGVFMKKLIISLSFFCFASYGFDAQSDTLTLETSVHLAHKNRDDLHGYFYSEQANKQDERAALAGYLPQFSINGKFGKTAPEALINVVTTAVLPQTLTDSTSTKGVTVSVSQLLLSGGTPVFDYRIAKEGTKIINSQMETAHNNIRFSTEQAFLNLQQKMLEKQAVQAQYQASQVTFEKNSSQKLVGFLNQSEWLSSAASYAKAKSDAQNYQYDLETAQNNLERETNTQVNIEQIDVSLQTTANVDLKPVDYYLSAALNHRPELRTQKHLIRQSRLSEKRYRRSYVPTVSAFAQASDIKLGTGYRSASWTAGVDFSWSFDGLASAHTARKYKHKELEYKLQKRDLELQIRNDVENAHYQVHTTMNKLKAEVVSYEQAEQDLELKKAQYTVGSLSRSELAQAEFAYKSAEFTLNSLKIGIRTTYQNLLYLSGYPKESDKSIRS